MNNSAKVLDVKINNVDFRFDINADKPFQLGVKTESQLLPPSDADNNTGLFKIKANIVIPDSDQLFISADANIIFEFDQIPSDYNEAGQNLCLKEGQKIIFEKIGDIMEIMGYKRFNIEIPD